MKLSGRSRKYGNLRTMVDGVIFDSKAESTRYRQLVLLQRAGEIDGLVLQPKYQLLPPFKDGDGKKQREIAYIGDFFYYVGEQPYVEDVKSKPTTTPVFKLKEKLFKHRYPGIKLLIVKEV